MHAPGDQPVKEAGLSDWETALGWQRRTSPEPGSLVMTDPGASARPARPASLHRRAASVRLSRPPGAALDVEASARQPGDRRRRARPASSSAPASFTIVARRGSRPGPLEQGDLGPVQLAAVAQLFLGDADLGAGLAEICGEALLRGHRRDSSVLTDRNSTDRKFPGTVARGRGFATFCSGIGGRLSEYLRRKR